MMVQKTETISHVTLDLRYTVDFDKGRECKQQARTRRCLFLLLIRLRFENSADIRRPQYISWTNLTGNKRKASNKYTQKIVNGD